MRTIDNFSHFVLAEGETLILRFTRTIGAEQLAQMRAMLEKTLPGRPVLILPPEVEVCAGVIEIVGGDEREESQADWDQVEADRRAEIEKAYDDGRTIWCKEASNAYGWFFIHKEANPIAGWAWHLYIYSLTKPKPGQ